MTGSSHLILQGVLYMVILNLPHAIRFKPENVLIVGIIPGPSEPGCIGGGSFDEVGGLATDDQLLMHA